MAELPEPDYDRPWQEWLGAVAEDVFDSMLRHPFLQDVDMAVVAATSPASELRGEQMLAALTSAGFSTRNAVLAISLMMTAAQQFATALARSGSLLDRRTELDLLASHGDTPLLAGVYVDAQTWDAHATYRSFLGVTLAGVAAELGPKRGSSRRRGRSS
jgi:hypothetical protein